MPYFCQRAETIFLFLAYGKPGTSRKNQVDQMGPTFGWQPRGRAEEADLETQQADTENTQKIHQHAQMQIYPEYNDALEPFNL